MVATGIALSAEVPAAAPAPAAADPVQHVVPPTLPEIATATGPDFRAAANPEAATQARALVGLYTQAGPVADIPTRALATYHRAATVIARAAPACNLEWPLVAAVGRVLTDHGSRGGDHQIDEEGRVSPAILSSPLKYRDGTPIPDTDGGQLDGDDQTDRAAGPFLLPPAMWRDIGVDGDGDGIRDPQDFDDAALAAAVMLCADGADLTDAEDTSRALARFAPDSGFVQTAQQVAAAYDADDGPQLAQAGALDARTALPAEAPVRTPARPESTEQKEQKSNHGQKAKPEKQGKPARPAEPVMDAPILIEAASPVDEETGEPEKAAEETSEVPGESPSTSAPASGEPGPTDEADGEGTEDAPTSEPAEPSDTTEPATDGESDSTDAPETSAPEGDGAEGGTAPGSQAASDTPEPETDGSTAVVVPPLIPLVLLLGFLTRRRYAPRHSRSR